MSHCYFRGENDILWCLGEVCPSFRIFLQRVTAPNQMDVNHLFVFCWIPKILEIYPQPPLHYGTILVLLYTAVAWSFLGVVLDRHLRIRGLSSEIVDACGGGSKEWYPHLSESLYNTTYIYIQLSCEFHRLLMIFAIPHSYPMPILIHCSDVEWIIVKRKHWREDYGGQVPWDFAMICYDLLHPFGHGSRKVEGLGLLFVPVPTVLRFLGCFISNKRRNQTYLLDLKQAPETKSSLVMWYVWVNFNRYSTCSSI